jgi:hypothetical protein
MNNGFKIVLLIVTFIILTTLLGEYVVSREINGYIQYTAVGIWLYINWRLSKILFKLIKL